MSRRTTCMTRMGNEVEAKSVLRRDGQYMGLSWAELVRRDLSLPCKDSRQALAAIKHDTDLKRTRW
jgi:hypothetical protein